MRDPGGVLGEIIVRKRADVDARLASATLTDLRARAQPTTRSLRDALAQKGARFVMEVKRASPSEGAIRAGADPADIAKAYTGAADAISVLTDTPYFGGSLEDLAAVRKAFNGPILAKDFVIDPRQVVEARLIGADSVLVMLSVLEDHEAREIMDEAERLGMSALVEVHDADEMCRATALNASLIGVNNRDLRSLKIDLATTEKLAAMAPAGATLISESGITDRADVQRLTGLADGFLVGSALMRAPNPAQAARAMVFGRVKVCGITSEADAEAACAAGATYIGAIMVPGTPRAVTFDTAKAIAATARAHGASAVGVFRDADIETVCAAAPAFDAVQLHGAESEAYIAAVRAAAGEAEIWKTAHVGVSDPHVSASADRILFDTKVGESSGGAGVVFDWARLKDHPAPARSILAGGLTPENAARASRVGAYALDVSSGVESAPGRKDKVKLAAFFEALRPKSRAEAQP
ncbi:MAG: bifunctional indole-3-glycerol-phosphate synthase TrpC/phosphoribosylanthranilate isomerase TrpF [Hyphomonadaceae bacterium]|nr:bifunctional indole-3-glycerol-phosphate synthase TrpC/phosphoribosylanthranilate isomerase TrpF [Hyphomonadaceae bacterium]